MKEYLRLFAKTGIALFCVGHMIAVGLYALPTDARDPVTRWMTRTLRGHVVPYMLITSQWQQWNLFAPNPLRRIVFYRIETRNADDDDDAWSYVTSINASTYGRWRHAVRFKLLGQVLEEQTNRPEIAARAARILCREVALQPDAMIRIWHDIAIVPSLYPSPSKAWWNTWTPHFERSLAIDTSCSQ